MPRSESDVDSRWFGVAVFAGLAVVQLGILGWSAGRALGWW